MARRPVVHGHGGFSDADQPGMDPGGRRTKYLVDEWVNNAWKQIGSLGSGSTGCAVTGLSPGTTYYFDVGAFNGAGTTWANYRSATTFQHRAGSTTLWRTPRGLLLPSVARCLVPTGRCTRMSTRQTSATAGCWRGWPRWRPGSVGHQAHVHRSRHHHGERLHGRRLEGPFLRHYRLSRSVTVDTELPSRPATYDHLANGVLWVALAEKAYV